MRTFLVFLLFCHVASKIVLSADASDRPNIVVICSDQHHWLKSGYRGHSLVKTPNLDRMAASGTYFSRAYCNAPICAPSRISFMTGKYAFRTAVWHNGVPWNGVAMTWARRLHELGIHTRLHGKIDIAGPHGDAGFSAAHEIIPREARDPYPMTRPENTRLTTWSFDPGWIRDGGTTRESNLGRRSAKELYEPRRFHVETGFYDHDRMVIDRTLEFLRSEQAQKPFVQYVGLLLPHWPYICPEEFYQMYDPDQIDLPFNRDVRRLNAHPQVQHFQRMRNFYRQLEGDEHLRRIISAYYGLITCMDAMIGEILNELQKQNIADDTYVIYTSDHGDSLGEHGLYDKESAYDGSCAVPLIISGPGVPKNTHIDRPVGLVDLYPTIMEIMNVQLDEKRDGKIDGQSWMPLMNGHSDGRRDYVFAEHHAHGFPQDWYMLVQDDFKYVYYANDRPSLFYLSNDPREMYDLAIDPSYEQALSNFRSLLGTIVDADAVALQSKRDMGLIGPAGRDFTLNPPVP